MTPRRQAEPSYVPNKSYPGRDAASFSDLSEYFEKASATLQKVADDLKKDPYGEVSHDELVALTDTTAEEIRKGIGQTHEARRLWIEFVTRRQYRTQRELAERLTTKDRASKVDPNAVSPGLIYNIRFDPLSTDQLTK